MGASVILAVSFGAFFAGEDMTPIASATAATDATKLLVLLLVTGTVGGSATSGYSFDSSSILASSSGIPGGVTESATGINLWRYLNSISGFLTMSMYCWILRLVTSGPTVRSFMPSALASSTQMVILLTAFSHASATSSLLLAFCMLIVLALASFLYALTISSISFSIFALSSFSCLAWSLSHPWKSDVVEFPDRCDAAPAPFALLEAGILDELNWSVEFPN